MNKFLFGILSVFIFSGCLMTRNEIAEIEQRKAVQQQVSSLQKTNADSLAQYSEINEDLRSIHGRVDVLENKIQIIDSSKEKAKETLEQQLAETNKKIMVLQEELVKQQNQISFLNHELAKPSSVKAQNQVKKSTSKKSDPNADDIKLGEEALANKDWAQAIESFRHYRDKNPKGKKYVIATYKIGLAFQELGMNEEATTFFNEVIKKFPDSNLAKLSEKRLKKK